MKQVYKQQSYHYGVEDDEALARGKYDDLLRGRKNEYKRKRAGLEEQFDSGTGLVKQYKSKYYEEYVSQEKDQKIKLEIDKLQKKKLQDKVGSYAKYVKEMYWPQVSD